jgi:hypothetical protein
VKLKPTEYAPPVEALPEDPATRAGPASSAPSDPDAAPGLDLDRELEGDARRDDDPRAMLREAARDLDAGRPQSAWRRVQRALLEAPSAPDAFPLLMRAALQQKKPDLAHLVALRAERAAPATPEIAYLRGRAYQAQKQAALARAEWIRAADAGRDDARRALLHVEFGNRNWPAVAVHASKLLERHPEDAVAQLALGVSQRHAGRPDEALATYAVAEKLGGGTLAEVHFARAILFAKVKADCSAAASELRRYALLAGAGAADDAGVLLQRDCERSRAAARAVSATATGAGDPAPSAVHADTQPKHHGAVGPPVGSPRP